MGGLLTTILPIDFWSALDGRGAAPSGAAQYPTMFTGLNGSSYAVRPPWHVPGVDYRVGINTGVVLKNPTTIDASIAILSGTNPTSVIIQRDNVTLDGYDFGFGGTWYNIVTNGFVGLTISNSRLINRSLSIGSGTPAAPTTIIYCEMDGLGNSGETSFLALAFMTGGYTVWKYNWIHDAQGDMLDFPTLNTHIFYNLFDTQGYFSTAHADMIQFAGAGTANDIQIKFNTCFQRIATNSYSSAIDLETQNDAGATMTNPEVAYNVASNNAPGNVSAGLLYRINQTTGSLTGANFHDNYADFTNMVAGNSPPAYGVLSNSPIGAGYQESRNILLNTGAVFS